MNTGSRLFTFLAITVVLLVGNFLFERFLGLEGGLRYGLLVLGWVVASPFILFFWVLGGSKKKE